MEILVLGAGGGVGRHAVALAAAAGHLVRAGARTPVRVVPAARPVAVDVRDAVAVRRAVAGVDAVLWCVGVTRRSGADVGRVGMALLVAAARDAGVERVVSVSGAGTRLAGDRRGPSAHVAAALVRALAGPVVVDKREEHRVLAASGLRWSEVRPPRLVEGELTGRWHLGDEAPGLRAAPVAKADVAAAMLHLATHDEWVRRSPFLVQGAR